MNSSTSTDAYKILIVTLLVTFISILGIALPYPILAPLFSEFSDNALTQFYGFPPTILLAIALAVYPLGVLFGSSFIGALSDVFGRKSILTVSLCLAAIGYLFSAWAIYIEHYGLFVLARLLTGVCEGNMAVCRAIALDLHPQIDKTRSMSFINASIYSGYLLGPLLGGYLMQFGADIAFLFAGCTVLLAMTVVRVLMSNTESKCSFSWLQLRQKIYSTHSFGLLNDLSLRPFIIAYFLLGMGINSLYQYFPLWLVTDFSISSMQIGITTAVLTFSMVLSSLFFVPKFKVALGFKFGIPLSLFILSVLLISMGWFGYAFTFWFVFPITGVVIALVNGLIPVYFSEHFHQNAQGRLMGLLTATFCLANVVMAMLGGLVALIAPVFAINVGGLLVMCAAILYFYFIAAESKNK
ncbi:MFS transporter [Algibacillus agarilyticus]|uniref:MFS transporter n=1 Tax=Algibacillus agarilyticus TaxID=2234133 RepID=UPI000DCFE329|nr:MFS transporter [Algibacillus agarilyticus]